MNSPIVAAPAGSHGIWVPLADGSLHCMYEPHPKQILFHQDSTTNLIAIGSRGSGKAVRLDTPIPTPTGFKSMAELAVGDAVFDERGQPCRVLWKSLPHIDDWGTYTLSFDDRSTITCGGHHEWNTISKAQLKTSGTTKTTREISETIKIQGGRETNHRIPLAKPWVTPAQQLPIDPYVLGIWLGDGTTNNGHITSADPFIVDQLRDAGYSIKKLTAQYLYAIKGLGTQLRSLDATEVTRHTRGLCAYCKLERCLSGRGLCYKCYANPTIRSITPKAFKGFKRFTGGVLGHKRIPPQYLIASIEQRLALLQGLMDSDGYCSKGGNVEFCSTNKNLANGVYQLAASLGLKPGYDIGRATLYGKDCGPKFMITWTATLPVFRLPRKLSRLPKVLRATQFNRYIVSCEKVVDELVQCIEVSSASHQYLVGANSIPTHNSLALRMDAHMRALSVPNSRLILIRKTYKQLAQSHLLDVPREMKMLGGTYHATDYVATYPNNSKLFFSYVGSDKDSMNLLSAEFLAAYFDELSVIPWEYFQKLCASVRVTNPDLKAVVRAATNPLGEAAGEVNKYFVTKDIDPEEDSDYLPEEWKAIRIDMEDNPSLDVDQYKKRFAGLAEHVKRAWLYGEFSDEDALFDFHPLKDGRPWHVINELDIPDLIKKARIFRVLDWGWAPDPCYCAWIAHLGNRYVVFHEKLWYKTIVPDVAADILLEDHKLGLIDQGGRSRVLTTYCDPTLDLHTGAEIRTNKGIFESHGIPMECSINNRELFASAVHTALAEEAAPGIPRLQVYQYGKLAGAPYLVRALPVMRYDEKRPMAMANHKHDHPVVSLAYFLISQASNEQRSFEDRKVPKWMQPKSTTHTYIGNDAIRTRH